MNKDKMGGDYMKNSVKDEFCVWQDVGRATVEKEVGEEYVLPDYLPDMRRILFSSVRIENGEHFVDSGKIEVVGEAVISVIYLSDSGEIKYISQSYPFDGFVNIDGVFDDSIVDAKYYLKNKAIRAVSPRKLSMKAKVLSEINAKNKICISPRLIGGAGIEDEFTLERKLNNSESANYMHFTENDIRISEDIDYSGRTPIRDLIMYDMDVVTTECKYSGGKLDIKGCIILKCLIEVGTDEDKKEYDVFEKKIPVSHTSDVNLLSDDVNCIARLEAGAFECNIGNDSYGESRVIELDVACRADITAINNEQSVFTDDVFSTVYDYSNTYKTVETERIAKCVYANFSSDGSLDLPDAEKNECRKVLYSDAEVEMNQSELKNGKLVMSGDCNIKAVIEMADNGYTNAELSFPVKYEMPINDIGEYRCNCRCDVLNSNVSVNEGRLNANVEIGLNAVVFDVDNIKTVEQISIDKEKQLQKPDNKTMILYYPEENETLWSIAKKYNVSRAELERENGKNLSGNMPRVIVIPAAR